MRLKEIRELVSSTADAAFAVDEHGMITAWNSAAESLMGVTHEEALGKRCGDIIQGMDQCGAVCSADCPIQQSVRRRHPMSNFDLQIATRNGRQWCNVSVLIVDEALSLSPFSIHIVRVIDMRKRLEMLMHDFVTAETQLPAESVSAVASTSRSAVRNADLSDRELEVLRMLARGATTAAIAEGLHISRTTVNNHVQHILQKLDAHNRLEAIRRAELAGLI